ncbi:MAG: hypothetical protein M1819_001952 [Sarea resinae]|nr:MAG: hypothetical protein M1819_001952 [Sarea resinae]
MSDPNYRFYVIAKVQASENGLPRWKEILVPLIGVAKTEPKAVTYYWGKSETGSKDLMWGIEGYLDAEGFDIDHPSSDTFKNEFKKVEGEKLLSGDPELHRYDFEGGWFKRAGDKNADALETYVKVTHIYTAEGKRESVFPHLADFTKAAKENPDVWSSAYLKEQDDPTLITLWERFSNTSAANAREGRGVYKDLFEPLKESGVVTEVVQNGVFTFNGFLDQTPSGLKK